MVWANGEQHEAKWERQHLGGLPSAPVTGSWLWLPAGGQGLEKEVPAWHSEGQTSNTNSCQGYKRSAIKLPPSVTPGLFLWHVVLTTCREFALTSVLRISMNLFT